MFFKKHRQKSVPFFLLVFLLVFLLCFLVFLLCKKKAKSKQIEIQSQKIYQFFAPIFLLRQKHINLIEGIDFLIFKNQCETREPFSTSASETIDCFLYYLRWETKLKSRFLFFKKIKILINIRTFLNSLYAKKLFQLVLISFYFLFSFFKRSKLISFFFNHLKKERSFFSI